MNIRPSQPNVRLAAATILQLMPPVRDEAAFRAALNIVRALRAQGARCVVASGAGPFVSEIRAAGCAWHKLKTASIDPFTLRRNAKRLERLLTAERIDIVHAHGAGAAWSALAATKKLPIWLVTTLPALPPHRSRLSAYYQSALGRGDRVIAQSSFAASAMTDHFDVPRERVAIVPRTIDLNRFSPAAIQRDRVIELRKSWEISDDERVVAIPGSLYIKEEQAILVDVARALQSEFSNVVFVLFADSPVARKASRAIVKRARSFAMDSRFRIVRPGRDLPAALAAADFVASPSIEPPVFGWPVPEAQAMARPVIASATGVLPEMLLAPPRMPDELRTGWLVPPGNADALARALLDALRLDLPTYRAFAARAREYAEFMFSPQSAAAGVLGVYTSLLEGR